MADTISDWQNDIHAGDACDTLAKLPESSIHMCMTSPPYFGLRDYGADGQIGLEDSLDEYISELVAVGHELRRVLRDDGSWWLNLGDSYAGSGRGQWEDPSDDVKESYIADDLPDRTTDFGRKNKMLVPHRVAIALQEDGWVVRNDVTWLKRNAMPSSVKDRLNTTTEQIFHLVPKPDYWYDLDAIREPHKERSLARSNRKDNRHQHSQRQSVANEETLNPEQFVHPAGKNPGDVFEVNTRPFPDAHFAVYPPKLVEKPLKSSCPPKVCKKCGSPYERKVERLPGEYDYSDRGDRMSGDSGRTQASGTQLTTATATHLGWESSCDCGTDATVPGIVLDPFAGAGTTCLVAKRLGRRFVGIDLNPEYVAMAQKRVGITVDQPELLLDRDETALTAYTDGGE